MHGKPNTIRRNLLVQVLVLNLLSIGALLILVYAGSRYVVSYFATSVVEQKQSKIQMQVNSLFEEISDELLRLKNSVELGLIDLDKPDRLNRLLQTTFNDHSQISSVILALDNGKEHMLQKLANKWQMRRTLGDVASGQYTFWDWEDGAFEHQNHQKKLKFDIFTRPWFKKALALRHQLKGKPLAIDKEFLHWTHPYRFYTMKMPGVTASITAYDPRGRLHVIGIDLTLMDISRYTTQMQVATHGMVFVFAADDSEFSSNVTVIGLPRNEKFMDEAKRSGYLLKHPSELHMPILNDGSVAFQQSRSSPGKPFRFTSGKEAWWGTGHMNSFGKDLHVAVAILVPESDVLGGIQWVRIILWTMLLVVLVASVFWIMKLARRFSLPIECLVQDMHLVSQGILDQPCRVQTNVREFVALAGAHENMRTSLQALLKMESDMQVARVIQQKTFPSSLPNLQGYDIEAWSQPADDTGGDTYDVIGLRSIDAESHACVIDEQTPDRALFLLADATGHGIGPALSATQLRAMLRMSVWTNVLDLQTIEHINEQMMRDMPDGRFITAWLGHLDIKNHQLMTFSAGQGPILHYHAKADTFESVEVDSPPLGIMAPLEITNRQVLTLDHGDIFVVFSDGIYEAMNRKNELFGEKRVQDVIRQHAKDSTKIISQAVLHAAQNHTDGQASQDDQTCILIKRI